MSYLGIQLTRTSSQLFSENYKPLFTHLRTLLTKWHSFKLFLMGRIVSIRITLLPKLLYYFITLPIRVPKRELHALQRDILKLVWAHKRHRTHRDILYLPSTCGGQALPDIYMYYIASHLRIIQFLTNL